MINVGEIVRTSYNTGPYVIKESLGPCTCPSYLDTINTQDPPYSDIHYHLTVQQVDENGLEVRDSPSWLNGYREDGTNVWRDDYLIFIGIAPETKKLVEHKQMELFTE